MTPNEAIICREYLNTIQEHLMKSAQYFDGEVQRDIIMALCVCVEMLIDRYDEKSNGEDS